MLCVSAFHFIAAPLWQGLHAYVLPKFVHSVSICGKQHDIEWVTDQKVKLGRNLHRIAR